MFSILPNCVMIVKLFQVQSTTTITVTTTAITTYYFPSPSGEVSCHGKY